MDTTPVPGETWQPPLTFAYWDARNIEDCNATEAVELFANVVGYVKPKVMIIQTTKEVRKEILPKTSEEELDYQIKEYGNLIVAIKNNMLSMMYIGNEDDRHILDLLFQPTKTIWRFSFTINRETEDCRIWIEHLTQGKKWETGIHIEKSKPARSSWFSIISCARRQDVKEDYFLENQHRNIDVSYLKDCDVNCIVPQEILNTFIDGYDIRPNDCYE